MNKNDILNTFHQRYACKQFDKNKIVSDDDFRFILETGILSPSSFGFEPWKFLVIQNEDMRKKLAPIAWGAQNSLNGASHFVIILARKAEQVRYDAIYIQEVMKHVQGLSSETITKKGQRFKQFQEEFKLLDSNRALFDWSSKQTYIPLANMMTAAALIGIDSCPIEGFIPEKVNKLLVNEGLLSDDDYEVSVMVGFGYRNEDITQKTRRSFEQVVQFVK